MKLTGEEKKMIIVALGLRLGIIETGNSSLRAVDIRNGHRGTVRVLTEYQKNLIKKHEDLMKRLEEE